jgi:hypothetical protein
MVVFFHTSAGTTSAQTQNLLIPTSLSGPYHTDFVYEGKNHLPKKVGYTWKGIVWHSSSETRSIYDGMLVVQERSSANTPTVTYIRALSGSYLFGVFLDSVENAVVENNIISNPSGVVLNSLFLSTFRKAHGFNNRSSDGQLLRLFNDSLNSLVPEMTTDAELVLTEL